MRRRVEARAWVIALALLATAALARGAPPVAPAPKPATPQGQLRGPIKITAERADLEQREVALYRGNVRLTSAEMELTGDRLELRQPVKGQFTARLTGKPARLKHKAVADAPAVAASASQIDYDTRSAMVEMTGGASIDRAGDLVSSETIRYNAAARRISASGANGRPVQIVIQPPANPPASK